MNTKTQNARRCTSKIADLWLQSQRMNLEFEDSDGETDIIPGGFQWKNKSDSNQLLGTV